ncbi:tRNA glutamyl-Q(34) synthetase GluQRS [Methylonatrum kenyense]|uniref:tRNA glutamyl-Q(34) synthetase GluQRS n=1 Tax=Methylonatrum kenyense TaxID=455253 RepID=UPI0020C0C441|nr:tRNA glutamyl-Q(34) synthetase GluQRS [Methylonatrum kenyense]MCK8515944.1 tRNA glutamyl-Q(34) synthetase GluQRS [Methylonatrum kenyense]
MTDTETPAATYCGRFAPSPTGPLHAGSLLSAVCSYLDARRHNGRWLVRIDDIDPPREMPGASDAIRRSLEVHGLQPDAAVSFQSACRDRHLAAIAELRSRGHLFDCGCSRRDLRRHGRPGPNGPLYPGTCRHGLPAGREARTLRLRVDQERDSFDDQLQGPIRTCLAETVGDFIVRRSDGLPAYHLAAAVDDGGGHITHVVRGHDLLWCTPPQRLIQRLLGLSSPVYAHLPVLVDQHGFKLSKQQGAAPLDDRKPAANLWLALQRLRQAPPAALRRASVATLWQWARSHWQPERLRGLERIVETGTGE